MVEHHVYGGEGVVEITAPRGLAHIDIVPMQAIWNIDVDIDESATVYGSTAFFILVFSDRLRPNPGL